MATSNRAGLIVIAGACLFIGGIGLAIGGSVLVEDWRYRREAVRATAIVTDMALRPATDDFDTVYEVSYRFTLTDGQPYTHSQPVPVHLWERVRRDAPAHVEYLPGQPASARIVEHVDRSVESIVAVAIGGAVMLAGLAALRAFFRRPRKTKSETAPRSTAQPVGAGSHVSFWSLA